MAYNSTSGSPARRSYSAPGAYRVLRNALTTGSTTSTHYQIELDRCYSNFGFQVITSSTKADKVTFQASLDGTNFSNIAGSTFLVSGTQASGSMIWVTGKPALHVRATLVTHASTKPITAYVAPGL